jgi:hypothetical protein
MLRCGKGLSHYGRGMQGCAKEIVWVRKGNAPCPRPQIFSGPQGLPKPKYLEHCGNRYSRVVQGEEIWELWARIV